MNKSLKKYVFLTGGGLILILGLAVFLFFDAFSTSQFRTMQDQILSAQPIDLRGLNNLHASGGNMVRFSDLQRKLNHIKGPKTIVDGMDEFHGYIKGIPTTFFAYQRQGSPSLKHLIRRWLFTGTTEIRLDLVTSEEDEAKKHGFNYKKINIGLNFIEKNESVDDIVDFFNSQPENSWLHFHCAHGKGRTSVLLVMFDILNNAPKVTLEEIVKRQNLLGSENLLDTEVWENGTHNKKMLEDRKKFIENFYAFVCQQKAGGIQRWSEWQHSLKS